MKKKATSKAKSEEYDRFEKLAKALITVPRSEIDKRRTEYEKKRSLRNERPLEC